MSLVRRALAGIRAAWRRVTMRPLPLWVAEECSYVTAHTREHGTDRDVTRVMFQRMLGVYQCGAIRVYLGGGETLRVYAAPTESDVPEWFVSN